MRWKIGLEHDGMQAGDYLRNVHAFSRRMTKAVKYAEGILINHRVRPVSCRLSAGDILAVKFPPEEKGAFMAAEEMPLSNIYEDEDILVLNKTAGIPAIPSRHHPGGTIANGLLAYYKKHSIPYTIHVVTRLDRDTSGLMLIAKHRYSHSLLAASQKAGEVKRSYQALAEGRLMQKHGTIERPIGRKAGSIIERTVTETGKRAVTHYQVICESGDNSLIKVTLETGRTHQIRVHFSSIGHPLAGDTLYGGSTVSIDRHALHCDELQFPHPATKEKMSFQLPLPNDMNSLLI